MESFGVDEHLDLLLHSLGQLPVLLLLEANPEEAGDVELLVVVEGVAVHEASRNAEVVDDSLGYAHNLLSVCAVEEVVDRADSLVFLQVLAELSDEGGDPDALLEGGDDFDEGCDGDDVALAMQPRVDQVLPLGLALGGSHVPPHVPVVLVCEYLGHNNFHVLADRLASAVAQVVLGEVVGVDDDPWPFLIPGYGHVGGIGAELVLGGKVAVLAVVFGVFEDCVGQLEVLHIGTVFVSHIEEKTPVEGEQPNAVFVEITHVFKLSLGDFLGPGDLGAHFLYASDVRVFVQHQFPELYMIFGALFEGILKLDFSVGVVVVPVDLCESAFLVILFLHLVLYHLQVVVLVQPVYYIALLFADYPPYCVVGLGPLARFGELQHPYKVVHLPFLREFLPETLQQGNQQLEAVKFYLGYVLLLVGLGEVHYPAAASVSDVAVPLVHGDKPFESYLVLPEVEILDQVN